MKKLQTSVWAAAKGWWATALLQHRGDVQVREGDDTHLCVALRILEQVEQEHSGLLGPPSLAVGAVLVLGLQARGMCRLNHGKCAHTGIGKGYPDPAAVTHATVCSITSAQLLQRPQQDNELD